MPIYEYECNACQHQFEVLQRMSDEPLTQCPQCDKEQLRKLISKVSFKLKGEGWYETDYKHPPKKQGNGDGKSEPTKDGAGEGAAKTEDSGHAAQSEPSDKPKEGGQTTSTDAKANRQSEATTPAKGDS